MSGAAARGSEPVSAPEDRNVMTAEDSPVPVPPPTDARRLAVECARLGDAFKGENITVLEMGSLIEITDYFVIMNGNNRRQIRAIGEEIIQQMKGQGIYRTHMDGLDSAVWVLTDFGDVIVHIFNEEARDYYDLDGLWADAPRVDWQQEPGFEAGGEKPAV